MNCNDCKNQLHCEAFCGYKDYETKFWSKLFKSKKVSVDIGLECSRCKALVELEDKYCPQCGRRFL